MKPFLLSATALVLSAAPALADVSEPVRVVELFTSQGCSSCPPANAFVADLSESSEETLTLSYGVTYWDYLGWKDTFGHSAFTDRQRQYRDALGSNMYTPQIVINGREDGPRFRRSQIERHHLDTELHLRETPSGLQLSGELPDGATLAVVSYEPGTQSVKVKRGENHGRTLTLANVVTGIDYHEWAGRPLLLSEPDAALAVLVHHPDSAAIVAAVRYERDQTP